MVSISKILSVICQEEMHRCEGWMHLMVYQWRPWQMADERSLQSKLHNVNGRSASGDRIILPRSSVSEVLWIKTVRLSAKQSGIFLSSRTAWQALNEEPRTKALITSVDTVENSVRSKSRVFLWSKEVIKFSPINSPIDVVRSLLNKSQNLFMLKVPQAFLACLENGFPVFTESSTTCIFILQGVALFICNSTEGQHRFLTAPCRSLARPTPSQSNVFFRLRAKEGRDLSFTCCEVFTSKTTKDVANSLEINTLGKTTKDVANSLEINTLEGKCVKAVFLKINTLEGGRIEAVFKRLPCLTTSQKCPKLSISIGTQSSRGDQKLQIRSILDRVRTTPRAVASLLVKSGWATSRTFGKKEWNTAVFSGSPSVNVWFQTWNRPSSGSQMLKSPRIMTTPLGYAGQCGWIRPNLPRNCFKVSSGSKWALTITRLCRPDWMFTWYLFGQRSLWMRKADPPTFYLLRWKTKNQNRGAGTWIAWRNSSIPCTSWSHPTL